MKLHSINTHKIKEIIALPRDKRVHYQIGSLVLAPYENEYFRAKVIGEKKRRRRRGRRERGGGRERERERERER